MAFDFGASTPMAAASSSKFEQAYNARRPAFARPGYNTSTSSISSFVSGTSDEDGADNFKVGSSADSDGFSSNKGTPRPPASARSGMPVGASPNGKLDRAFEGNDEDDQVGELPSRLHSTSSSTASIADADSLLTYVNSLKAGAGSSAPRQPLQRTYSESTDSSQGSRNASSERIGDSLYKTALQMRHARNLSTESTSSTNSDDGLMFGQRPAFPHRSSSTSVNASSAANSKTSGIETIDLSHKRIAEMPVEVIEAIAGTVERLALGYNYMQTLPPQFNLLGKTLRYLNVRVNAFTIFPTVLCELPSLEILDVRGNKIKKLPKTPGSLLNLKVLVLSKNRIRRLPPYFAQMTQLRVLKVDHNPIEWPPRDIIALPTGSSTTSSTMDRNTSSQSLDFNSKAGAEEARVMQKWLSTLQTWIRDHPVADRSLPLRSYNEALSSSDDETPVHRGTLTRSNNLTLPLNLGKASSPPLPSPTPSPFADTPRAKRQDEQGHSRNASASLTSPKAVVRPLRTKKSLPELRLGSRTTTSPGSERSPALPNQPVRYAAPQQMDALSRTMDDAKNEALDRNSGAYFRRLSMLPPTSMSKAIPITILSFVDAVRGILFSLSQVYSAIKQFVVFATQDRLPAALERMMGSADTSMSALINALDRFDSLSRKRNAPQESHYIRDVFEACRENVSIFAKLVGVLGIQLKAFTSKADLRYTRTLLIMLYGSLGEIVLAWKGMATQSDEVTRLLAAPSNGTQLLLQPPTPSSEAIAHQQTSLTAGVDAVKAAPNLSQSTSSLPSSYSTGQPRARRHAGSFSVEDVQTGAGLPTATSPLFAAPLQSTSLKPRPNAPTLGSLSNISIPTSMPYMDLIATLEGLPPTPSVMGPPTSISALRGQVAQEPLTSHRTFGTENATSPLPQVSAAISASTPTQRNGSLPSRNAAAQNVAQPTTSSKAVDADYLEMASSTTSVAFSVCNLLHEHLDASQHTTHKLTALFELVDATNEAARKLRATLDQLQRLTESGQNTTLLHKPMTDDSDSFAKAVIQLAKHAKEASTDIQFTRPVREGLSQLAKATHSLLAMRSVSSFR